MNIQLLKHKIGHRIWTTKQKEEQLTQFSVINLTNRLLSTCRDWSNWLRKSNLSFSHPQEFHLTFKDRCYLRMKAQKQVS